MSVTGIDPDGLAFGPRGQIDAVLARRENDRVAQRAVLGERRAVRRLLERAAVVRVRQGERLGARERGRQRELAQIRIVVHLDVQHVLEAHAREHLEIVLPQIPASQSALISAGASELRGMP